MTNAPKARQASDLASPLKPSPPAGSWRYDRTFLVIAATSMLLKLILAVTLRRVAELDEAVYLGIARRWLAEGAYPTTFRPPLYPALVAVSVASGLGTVGIRLVQAVMSSLTLIPVYRIGQRTYGLKAARVAVALVAFDPVLVTFSNRLWSETVFIMLLMMIVDLITRETATWRRWALAGVLFGLAALTRPVILALLPGLAFWVFLQAPRNSAERLGWLSGYLVLLLACGAVVLPWSLRNLRATGTFILVDTNGPYNFLLGTRPDAAFVAKEDTWTYHFGLVAGQRYEDVVDRDPAATQRLAMTAARANIAADPGLFLRKSLWEAGHLWTADSFLLRYLRNGWYGPKSRMTIAVITVTSVAFFFVLVLAGLAGLAVSPAGLYREIALLLLATFTILFGLVYAVSRYSLPLHPILALPAGVTLVALRPTFRALIVGTRLRRRVAFWLAALSLVAVWITDIPKLEDMITARGAHYRFHWTYTKGP